MNPAIWLPTLSALVLVLSGCSTDPSIANDPHGTGPFDSNGNYIEDWADDPSKWKKPGSRTQPDDLPLVAKNEQPPANATPLAPSHTSTPKPTAKPAPVVVKSTPKPTAKPKPASTSKPKPKPKPKPKATTTRYTVKKGDTLSGIASRHGSSVSKIRSANRISGSIIRPGQSLVIPKR